MNFTIRTPTLSYAAHISVPFHHNFQLAFSEEKVSSLHLYVFFFCQTFIYIDWREDTRSLYKGLNSHAWIQFRSMINKIWTTLATKRAGSRSSSSIVKQTIFLIFDSRHKYLYVFDDNIPAWSINNFVSLKNGWSLHLYVTK